MTTFLPWGGTPCWLCKLSHACEHSCRWKCLYAASSMLPRWPNWLSSSHSTRRVPLKLINQPYGCAREKPIACHRLLCHRDRLRVCELVLGGPRPLEITPLPSSLGTVKLPGLILRHQVCIQVQM